jgi:hypothetical protein
MMSIFLLFLFISSLVDVLHVKYMEDDVNLVIMWSCNPQSRLRLFGESLFLKVVIRFQCHSCNYIIL